MDPETGHGLASRTPEAVPFRDALPQGASTSPGAPGLEEGLRGGTRIIPNTTVIATPM